MEEWEKAISIFKRMDEERDQAIIMDEERDQAIIMDEEREQAIIMNKEREQHPVSGL